FLVLTEWVARGEWTPEIWTEYIRPHYESYILSWMLLALIWAVVDTVTRLAPLATFVSGCAGLVPAAVNFYTLQLRGEPFLPWDLTQGKEAAGVAAAAGLKVPAGMVWAGEPVWPGRSCAVSCAGGGAGRRCRCGWSASVLRRRLCWPWCSACFCSRR